MRVTTLSHYKILAELGRGGMGVVYRARDQKLKREVALKTLPEKGLSDPQTRARFIQEAQSAAALKHPNIAVVYEIDEAEGMIFIAMELVEGRRLRDVLAGGELDVGESLRLAGEIAEGLRHAHRRGIVHRDLKPNNIMVTDEGHAKIIDFGLAKILAPLVPLGEAESDLLPGTPELTEAGVLVGTLSYMSPEQARGEKIDRRSDIFSFGTVLFEMLTGTSPFQRAKAVDTLAAILRDPTPSLEESLGDGAPLVPDLQHIVERCLAKSPEDRYESAAELVSDLAHARRSSDRLSLSLPLSSRRSSPVAEAPPPPTERFESATVRERPAAARAPTLARIAGVSLVLLAAAGVAWRALAPGDDVGPALDETPLVAVGPFENLTGEAELGWLDAGLSNLVRDKLAQSKQLITVSKPRWESIRGASADEPALHESAAASGIDYIVSGELLPSPRGVVLTARLSDLRSGTDAFAYSFEDLTPEQVLARADALASLAKQGIGVPPEDTVDSFAADVAVDNIAAYQAYVSGLEFFQSFDYERAERAFRLALDLAPGFAIASYRLAHLYAATGRRELARVTMAAIPEDAKLTRRERLYVDAARALFEGETPAAIETYRTLLEEFPYDVEGRQFLAEAYFLDYQDGAAIEELRKLGAQEPENELVWSALGTYLILSGRAAEARGPLARYLELAPDEPHPHTLLGDLERQLGDRAAAERHFRDALKRDETFSLARLGLAQTIALQGRLGESAALLSEIVPDESVEPEDRITAALDLANLRRAQYRFEEAFAPLDVVESQIRDEGVREPLSRMTRAMSALELERYDEAERLIEEAVQRDPRKMRHRFARGVLEMRRGDVEALLETARVLRESEDAESEAGAIARRAAAYLEGWAALLNGDAQAAVERFEEAVSLPGYVYTIYEAGLAEALRQAGDLTRAAELAERAVSYRDPSEVRLDLELDRVRAQLLLARIHAERGDAAAARAAARAYLNRVDPAPESDHPDLRAARELLTNQ